ncbi:MAG: hypothetical protein JWP83_666 [Mycobacterium sp.]|jgi:hypothetical protein|uniref:hypothetical protein n=1 Tax=Mycobacterium sp. TaxID=1785 RepID=UPI002610FD35|nr:hypothetical protein [Mycobacterium sp.]MCW2659514.1 hypothetical protein [Mycobacterium sp.]
MASGYDIENEKLHLPLLRILGGATERKAFKFICRVEVMEAGCAVDRARRPTAVAAVIMMMGSS